MADDAGDGGRGADRVGALDPHLARSGQRPAPGLSAAGPGIAHDLSARRAGPVRLLVPRGPGPGRVRPGEDPQAAAGVGDGLWLLALVDGAAAAPRERPRICSPAGGACSKSSAGSPRHWSGTAREPSAGGAEESRS